MSEESITREDFEINFDKAAAYVKNNPNVFNTDQALKLYGLYKLSLTGKCNIERPSGLFTSIKRQSMWDAWNDVSQKNIKNPKQMYVDYLTELQPLWG
jgi:acyl-CoA-binding protein